MKKRQSIKSTYDSAKDGLQYVISTGVNNKSIGSKEIADPFVNHKVKVSLLDTIKGLFRGGVEVGVYIRGKDARIEEDVLELDEQYLGQNATRRDEFDKNIFGKIIRDMDNLEKN